MKSLEHQKNLRTDRVLYFGLELTMHVLKSQIHLVKQSWETVFGRDGKGYGLVILFIFPQASAHS